MTGRVAPSPPRQQTEDLRGGLVVAILIAFAVLTALGVLVTSVFLRGQRQKLEDASLPESAAAIGQIEQRAYAVPGRGQIQEEQARRALERYALHDREPGIASIPIERAFDWMLADPSAAPPTASTDPVPIGAAPAAKPAATEAGTGRNAP